MLQELTNTRNWGSILRISKTHMQTFLMCPRKFYFQYVVGAAWEFLPVSLPFGKALHQAVAFFYTSLKDGHRSSLDDVWEAFTRSWHEEITDREIQYGNSNPGSMEGLGKAMLQCFYDEIRPRQVQAVEYPFCIDLSDPDNGEPLDFKLVGIIDLV